MDSEREALERAMLATPAGPGRLADQLVCPPWDRAVDLLVLVGQGAGRVAKELLARGQVRIIVFLADGPRDPDLPAQAIVVSSLAELGATALGFGDRLPDRILTKRLPGAAAPASIEAEITDALRGVIEQGKQGLFTQRLIGPIWLAQSLANLRRVARWPSVVTLRDAFAGVPCVIASPGPSLTKNVHLLANAKGKALIVAPSRTVAGLEAVGVSPDLVLIADRLDLRYHLEGARLDRIGALVLAASVFPPTFELAAPRIFTFPGNRAFEGWIYERLGETDARLPSGGSVAHAALSLAWMLGCDPILFVGQDLAFTGDQIYATSTADGAARLARSADGERAQPQGLSSAYQRIDPNVATKEAPEERVVEVPGYYGGTVATSYSMMLFRHWFGMAAKASAPSKRLLNCTEGGAHLDGMEHVSLAEALERHVTGRSEEAIGATLDERIGRIDLQARALILRQGIARTRDELRQAATRAKQCAKLLDKARSRRELFARLANADNELVALLDRLDFVRALVDPEIRAGRGRGVTGKAILDWMKASRLLYAHVEKLAAKTVPALEAGLAALALDPHSSIKSSIS